MIGWIILGVVVLILVLLCLVPVGFFARYDEGEFTLRLTIAFWHVTLVPSDKQKAEKKMPEPEKAEPVGKKPEKARLKLKRPNLQQIGYSIRTLLPLLGRAVKKAGKGLQISPLRLSVILGGEDPADVANWYGKALILRESLYPALDRLTQIRHHEILIDTDYDSERTKFSGQVGIRIYVGSLLWISLGLMRGLIAWYRGYRALETSDKKTGDKRENRQAKAA